MEIEENWTHLYFYYEITWNKFC